MEVTLEAQPRPGIGKGPSRQARRDGRVPGILYGAKIDPVPLSVDAKQMSAALHTEAGANVLISLEIDASKHLTLAREIQRHPIRGSLIHVDFVVIDRSSKITAAVPVHVVGESAGVKAGGQLDQHLHEISIEALPGEVPPSIEIDITALEIGQSVRISDLAVVEGVEILTGADELVLAIIETLELKTDIEVEEPVEEVEAPAEGEVAAPGDQEAKPGE